MKRTKFVISVVILSLSFLVVKPFVSEANENNSSYNTSVGVSLNGWLITPPKPNVPEGPQGNSSLVSKPNGRLPQTNDQNNTGLVSLGVILLGLGYVLQKKDRKKVGDQE